MYCTTAGVTQHLIKPIESQGHCALSTLRFAFCFVDLFVVVFSLLLVERGGGGVGVARMYF